MVHYVAGVFPRPERRIAHGIADALRAACRGESEVVMVAVLVHPRPFLIVFDFGELDDFAVVGNHVTVQLHTVQVRVAPVHVGLSVVVHPHGGVDVIPVFLLPHERFADRVCERAVRRVGHKHAYAMAVYGAVHVPLAVTFHHLLSPGAVVSVIPFEVF